jgi:signal transduction histidine kinase
VAERLTRGTATPGIARPAFGIVLVMVLMMAVAGVFGVRIFDSLEQLHDSASRASDVAQATDAVLDTLQDSETALRGYLLTMRPSYLAPYLTSRAQMETALHHLDEMAADSPWLHDEMGKLHADAEARMAEIDRSLAAYRGGGPDAALAVILTDQGRRAMEAVRGDCNRILLHANAEREERTGLLIARERETLYSVMAAALAGMLLLGCAALGLLVSRTRLVWAQSALSIQSGRLQATVDHIRDGVAVFDAADGLILWNASFFPIAGLPPSLGVPGTTFARFAAAAAAAGWEAALPSGPRAGGEATDDEIRVRGRTLEVWRSAMPDGGHILTVTDITRRTRAEAIARQAQKMEALGQLTGGVAHDFNNLLQVISANLELLGTRLSGDGGGEAAWLRTRLDAARAGVVRGARLVQHLLAFARRQPLTPAVIDPAALLRGMEEMLRSTLGSAVRLELDIPAGIWAVRADPHQLESALLNLAINGRDAIAAAGPVAGGVAEGAPGGAPGVASGGATDRALLRIAVANTTLAAPEAAQQSVEPGDYVALAVTDSGAGMSEETVARAVEPFFTTKLDGKGTGLGLPMAYGFARQSGGGLRIVSAPGSGTTVSLLIPRTAEQPVAAAGPPEANRPPAGEGGGEAEGVGVQGVGEGGVGVGDGRPGGLRILLVEDDPPVRTTTSELLQGLGHRVAEAGTANEALARLDRDIDVLMTDLGLPDKDGHELARQALTERPELAVIIASGKPPAGLPDDKRIVWLDKPYSASRLAASLAAAVEARA